MTFSQRIIRKYYLWRVRFALKVDDRPCVLCGNNSRFTIVAITDRYGLPVKTVTCDDCGFLQTRPAPTEKFLEWFYGSPAYRGLYQGKLRAQAGVDNDDSFRRAETNTAFIRSHVNVPHGAAVLDFGSADGEIALALKRIRPDLQVYGLEPGAHFSDANSGKLDGIFGDIREMARDKKFDLITSYHVLEHVRDPIQILIELKKHLTMQGVMVLAVPSVSQYGQNERGSFLSENFHIAHLHHFSKDIFEKTAEIVGMKLTYAADEILGDKPYGVRVILTQFLS